MTQEKIEKPEAVQKRKRRTRSRSTIGQSPHIGVQRSSNFEPGDEDHEGRVLHC